MTDVSSEHEFEFGQSYCPPPRKYEEPPKIMRELADFLKEKGHECVGIVGMKDHKFEWCMKDECSTKRMHEDMNRRQKEENEFVKKLESEGHTCITILECYPSRTRWCQSNPCKGE